MRAEDIHVSKGWSDNKKSNFMDENGVQTERRISTWEMSIEKLPNTATMPKNEVHGYLDKYAITGHVRWARVASMVQSQGSPHRTRSAP